MSIIKTWVERLAYPHSNSREQSEDAMQAEITELREALKVTQAEIKRLEQWHAEMTDDRNALQAKLSAIEAQEPVGKFNWNTGEFEWLTDYKYALHHNKPLYLAAPVAPAQPANELVEFPSKIMSLLNDVSDRKGTEFHWPWEDGNGEPLQDDADAAIAWINAKADQPLTKEKIEKVVSALESCVFVNWPDSDAQLFNKPKVDEAIEIMKGVRE